jgi:hypothetical protein
LTNVLEALREQLAQGLASAQEDIVAEEAARDALTAGIARQVAVGQAAYELASIEIEFQRRHFANDPVSWVEHKLSEHLWSAQKRVLLSVRDNSQTLVQSCHEIGKSFIAARAAGWWLDTHRAGEAAVVTTAPTNRQVKSILWKEIGRVHSNGLPGRVNQTEWYVTVRNPRTGVLHEEKAAFGFKPADWDPTAFQGIHARFLLVIVDEACGVRGDALWNAIMSLCANDNARLLLQGNPDFIDSEFYDFAKPGSGFNVIQIGAFDTPAFTGEPVPPILLEHLVGRTYVEKMRKKWASDWQWTPDGSRVLPPAGTDPNSTNPFWQSKVLGLFPTNSDPLALIPLSWIRAAMEREFSDDAAPDEYGVDVGGGGDSSTIAHRKGRRVRIVHEDHNPDTMQTCGNVLAVRKKFGPGTVKVDKVGIGKGMCDRSVELAAEGTLEEPFVGVNVGESSSSPSEFANLRAELWWSVREQFEKGQIDIDPEDEDLAAELCSIRFTRTSRGQIQIESKKDAKRRGVASPNRADSLMLACSEPKHPTALRGGLLA